MSNKLIVATLVFVAVASPSLAAPDVPASCMQAWTAADADKNGVLVRSEDKDGLIDRAGPAGRAGNDSLTRDEYLSLCSKQAVNEAGAKRTETGKPTQSSDNLPADRGKGDLTRGTSKLTESDVRKRLESQGYNSISDLQLGNDGIWRGTAETAPGRRSTVSVDAQGDVVAR